MSTPPSSEIHASVFAYKETPIQLDPGAYGERSARLLQIGHADIFLHEDALDRLRKALAEGEKSNGNSNT